MTERQSDTAPAHPVPKLSNGSGLTKREYAAIHLRIPNSGLDWLDDMINEANKLDNEMIQP